MSRMLKGYIAPFLILCCALFILQACSSTPAGESNAVQNDYQFGDITKGAVEKATNLLVLRYRYCTEKEPAVRQATLEIIKVVAPSYPTDGICMDLPALIQEVQALRQAAEATQDSEVEIEGVEAPPGN